jgi:hypothetical protein
MSLGLAQQKRFVVVNPVATLAQTEIVTVQETSCSAIYLCIARAGIQHARSNMEDVSIEA